MAILNFSDVLEKAGLAPENVKLIRHALSDKGFRECYNAGMVREYTQHQKENFSKGYGYWVTFISEGGTYARLHSCYRVNGAVPDTPEVRPAGLPPHEAEAYRGEAAFFNLEYVDVLKEYEGKLVIDWGASARMWHQKATTPKPIIAIEPKNQKPFVGFEELILSFDELKKVVENDTDYALWQAAMSSVNAVYLIVNTRTGDRYIGSTYNYDGLLGRWSAYVTTGGHGGNKGMIDHLKSGKHSCHDLQFSVLQILPKSLPNSQIIATETLWKKKLLTYEPFGMNQNYLFLTIRSHQILVAPCLAFVHLFLRRSTSVPPPPAGDVAAIK